MAEIRYQRFDTPGVDPRERFDCWRTWHAEALDTRMRLDPVREMPTDFRSSAESLQVGEVSIVQLDCGPSIGTWRRRDLEASDQLRLAVFHRAAGVSASWHGREVRLSDGTPVLLGRTGGRWVAPDGFGTIQVNVPRRLVPLDDCLIDRITARHLPERLAVLDTMMRPALLGMIGHLGELAEETTTDLAVVWLSLMTLLLRTLGNERTDEEDLQPARRAQVQRFIEVHLADPQLSPDRIAAALYLSRRSLYRLLSSDGPGVAAEIRECRLSRARRLLLDPARQRRSIASIGAEVGLPVPAHFSRLFKTRYGVTPRELRGEGLDNPGQGSSRSTVALD